MAFGEQIREAIASVMRQRAPDVRILSVNIHDNEDDNSMVTVNVVYETSQRFDPRKLARVPADIVAKLGSAGRKPFPVLSFIAKSDLGKTKPEAA